MSANRRDIAKRRGGSYYVGEREGTMEQSTYSSEICRRVVKRMGLSLEGKERVRVLEEECAERGEEVTPCPKQRPLIYTRMKGALRGR